MYNLDWICQWSGKKWSDQAIRSWCNFSYLGFQMGFIMKVHDHSFSWYDSEIYGAFQFGVEMVWREQSSS